MNKEISATARIQFSTKVEEIHLGVFFSHII